MFVITRKNGDVLLSVHVQPKSSRECFTELYGDSVKISIKAPPVDGKANKAITQFLAAFFKVPRKGVQIHSGKQSRKKKFLIAGVTEEEVRTRVLEEINFK